jgi:hypothetical protein
MNWVLTLICMLLLLVLIFLFGLHCGAKIQREHVEKEAIKNGVGEYIIIYENNFENLHRSFRWKPCRHK